jgi:hypothetical protein
VAQTCETPQDPAIDAEAGMFESPGIDADDMAWIERDQFVYFTEMERQLGDPRDWPRFRHGLALTLQAALGIDPCTVEGGHVGGAVTGVAPPVLASLDSARRRHDPATEWDGFIDRVWSDRRLLRPPAPRR